MVNETLVDPSRGMQMDTLLASLRLAELGIGVALARSSMVEDMLADGRLVEPFALRIPASESFYLVRKSGTELSTEATIFLDWLERQR
jgi:LysR family glycine cleavage system transcriptional activator